MSKEIKVSDVFNLLVYGACVHVNFVKLKEEYNDGVTPFDLIDTALNDHDRLTEENTALRESLRLKEAECETLASDISRIVSAAADAYLSGSEQQHVDHLYRVIHDASGKLYNDEMGEGDD